MIGNLLTHALLNIALTLAADLADTTWIRDTDGRLIRGNLTPAELRALTGGGR